MGRKITAKIKKRKLIMAQYKPKKQVDPTEYRVPRNFKLLDELNCAEKGNYTDAKKWGDACNWVTLGLDGQDSTFTHWNASIIPHQGGHIGDRIYSLKIKAGHGYPEDPPIFTFIQKVAMQCVTNTGNVKIEKLKNFSWHSEKSLFEVLLAIRKEMEPSIVAQACSKIAN